MSTPSYDVAAALSAIEARVAPPTWQHGAPAPARPVRQLFFGPYEIVRLIGSGGVAEVYRVRHVHPDFADLPLALKLLQTQSDDNERIGHLFRREAGVQSLIRHPNIVETFEAGVQEGRSFLAMEFILGGDLDHLLERMRAAGVALPPALAAFVACELLSGLDYAHDLHDLSGEPLALVHRDVNPANCFLSRHGDVKLGDFGVASIITHKKRRESEIAGKVGYFAPEHLAGEPVDARSDLFALAATLFEMLAGRRLFDGPDEATVLERNEQCQLPDLRTCLPTGALPFAATLQKALSRQPKARHASAAELRAELLPLAAAPKPARLLLQAMVRHFFALEMGRELMSPAASRGAADDLLALWREQHASAPRVALAMDANDHAADLFELLAPQGYDVFWAHGREGAQRSADVIVLEHGQEAPARERLQALPSFVRGHTMAVVAADAFDLAAAQEASAARARDLWVRPLRLARVAVALDEMLRRKLEAHGGRVAAGATVPVRHEPFRAILAVGQGAVSRLAQASLDDSDLVTFVASDRLAIERLERASFDAVIIDARAVGDVAQFLEHFRAARGMGPVPAVGCGMSQAAFAALPARLVAAADDEDLAQALTRAQQSVAPGEARAYARFDVVLPVRLRFAGRVFRAETVNISRRGLLLSTPFLPSVGAELGLEVLLPAPFHRAISIRARAQRASLRGAAGDFAHAQLGVSLGRFESGAEHAWVQLILAQPDTPPAGLLERAARWLTQS